MYELFVVIVREKSDTEILGIWVLKMASRNGITLKVQSMISLFHNFWVMLPQKSERISH